MRIPLDKDLTAYRFITIEGLDGVGKSTIVRLLAERIGGVATQTPDPSLRVKRQRVEASGQIADKWAFYMDSMVCQRPQFEAALRNHHVVCDRYIHSTLAYQWPQDAPLPRNPREMFPKILWPDLSFLLLSDEATRRQRLHGRETAEGIVNPADHRTDVLTLSEQRFKSMPDLIQINTAGLSPSAVCDQIFGRAFQ